MSHRLTIVLTDEEFGDLEQRAEAERRSVRDMAEYIITRPQTVPLLTPSSWPIAPIQSPPWNPIWPPNVCRARAGTTTTPPTSGTICYDIDSMGATLNEAMFRAEATREGHDA